MTQDDLAKDALQKMCLTVSPDSETAAGVVCLIRRRVLKLINSQQMPCDSLMLLGVRIEDEGNGINQLLLSESQRILTRRETSRRMNSYED